MAEVAFNGVEKIYDNGFHAVHELSLDIPDGEFLVLVGPSGCGKTTALRMVAGLEEISAGELFIGDRVVNKLTPKERDIAMVFQNYALYPHLSVYENIAFGLRLRKEAKDETHRRVTWAAQMLDLTPYLDRKPKQLSGGQRQRVAMGRAIVRQPQVFLMDEPLSNLDAKLRVQMRAELIALHKRLGITTVYVTHDQTEAMTLGDRVVVLRGGVVQQIDAPERLYRHPTNTFVAGFIGSPAMNFLDGRLEQGAVELGGTRIELPDKLRQRLSAAGGDVIVGVRPEDFVLGTNGSSIRAEVAITEALGPETLAHLRAEGVRVSKLGERSGKTADEETGELSETVVVRFDSNTDLRAGSRIELAVNVDRLQLFDAASGESLLA